MTPARPIMRYYGSKWRIAPWIIGHFPPHHMYVEPFGGGASVLMRKTPSRQEVYNDLDDEVVNVFRVLRDSSQAGQLTRMLALTPHSRAEYDLSCELLEPSSDPVERARRTLARAYMGYGNPTTGQYKTGFRNRHRIGDSNLALAWAEYPWAIREFTTRLRSVTLERLPALECIPRYDDSSSLFYVDPPYLLETRNSNGDGYRYELTTEQHIELAELLHSVRGMVVLSGYDSPLYRDLYADWSVATCETRGEKAAARTECLWLSPNAQTSVCQRLLWSA